MEAADCNGLEAGDLKAVDFDVPNLLENRVSEQYFIVCVPESTDEDIETRMNQRARAYVYPTGNIRVFLTAKALASFVVI